MNFFIKNKIFILFLIIDIACLPLLAEEKAYHLPDIEEFQLNNGMRVLISPNYDNPTVYISIYLNAGSLDDPLDQIGLAGGAFWLMKEATIKYPKEGQIKEKLFSLGSADGSFKYMSLNDNYGYIENYFLKEDIREGIELFSEVLTSPTYPLYNKWMINLAVRLLPKKTFIGHGHLANIHIKNQYANKIEYLHPKHAMGYSKKNMMNWYDKYIRPENITLMVTGDINYIYIRKLVNEYFGDWKSTEPMPKRRDYPLNLTENSGINIRFVNIEGRKDAMVRIITNGPSVNDSWHTAGQMAILAFGDGGFSSRLAKIHDKFNRYSYLYYDWQKESRLPYTIIKAETKYADLSNLFREIKSEFEKLANNSITDAELEQTKSIRLNYYNGKLYNPEKYSDFIQTYYNNNGYSLDKISGKWEEVQNVTLNEANEAAARIFDPDNFMMVVLGNRDSCATFLEQFEDIEYYEQVEELRASASNP